jgi:5-methylcytosine-specific restriction endonuclease McrA
MEHTLVLNATYEPINIINWKRALTLLFQGKVEVLAEYDREVRSISFTIKMPSVLRLLKYVKVRKHSQHVKFCRANIYARDHHTCQYCGKKCSTEDLTFDHVVPIVKGGAKTWENIVTCCFECNHKKGGCTPEEAGMRLIRHPKEPEWVPSMLHITIGFKTAPQAWRDYLYWNISLESETS